MRRIALCGLAAAAAGCGHTGPATRPAGHDCRPVVDRCADIPAGAIPAPAGTYANAAFRRQADRAEYDDFVIYYHEWLDGTATPGPFGAIHLARLLARVPSPACPLVIQPEADRPQLTAERQRVVVEALANAGVPNPAALVVVAYPSAEGLYGREAERIEPLLLRGGAAGGGLGGFGGGVGGVGGGVGGSGGGLGGIGGGLGGFGGGVGGFGY